MTRFTSASSALLVAALAVVFVGCAEKTDEPEFTANIVPTTEDLPQCSQGKYAIVFYVEDPPGFWYCDGWEYIALNPPDDSCTVEDNGDGTKTVRCPDGTSVTVNDVECLHEPAVCNDGDACTAETCDQAVGCISLPIDCDDGDACTTDSCDSATGCVNGPVVCDDGDLCTFGVCRDSAVGCEFFPKECPEYHSCNPETGDCDPDPGNCPCFTADELANQPYPWAVCETYGEANETFGPGDWLRESVLQVRADTYQHSYVGEREPHCYAQIYNALGNLVERYAWLSSSPDPQNQPLSPQDWVHCRQLITDQAEASGLVCIPR